MPNGAEDMSRNVNTLHVMTDREESFLKDFFTHVANLGFDKAKELVVSDVC
jgi:hypothetical protein